MIKSTITAALVVAMCVLSSCGQQSADSGSRRSGGDRLVVGFSQIGAESGWRTANTKSIQSEAQKRGIDLRFADAQQRQENQIRALRNFIAQGVDVISFSPVVETGWEPVLREIKAAGIPVVLSDRSVSVSDETLFVSFIGSDFVEEGRRAARWLVEESGGSARIAELQGTPGSAPANDRKRGFTEVIADHNDIQIIMSQTGDFTRSKGKEVMETFLKSPRGSEINVLFAHNDDMALGAIQAIEEAGLKPGKDILIVSIDGVRDAFVAMQAGKLNCTVECNPLIGPQLFDLIEAVARGEEVPRRVTVEEGVFVMAQAEEALPTREY